MPLKYLFSNYFHQDWTEEATTVGEVVAAFLGNEPSSVLAETLRDLERLLAAGHSDSELNDILLNDLGSYYDPHFVGQETKSFLLGIQEQIRAALSDTGRNDR